MLLQVSTPRFRIKTRFIVNPRSGAAVRALPRVREFAARHGAEISTTTHPGHGTELAAAAVEAGCELVVAVGGDGTLNEVARALIDTNVTCGLIPCGSGDGLGRHLRIHGPPDRALEILRSGKPRIIDTGLADGRPFFTAAGLGFEAEVAQRFNQLKRRGFLRYLTTGARHFRSYRPVDMTVETDAGRERRRVFTLAVANSDQYGNRAFIAPGARVDDGLLNLSIISDVTFYNSLPLVWRLFSGGLTCSRHVHLERGPRFVIERPLPGPIHTDGEIYEAGTRVEFMVRPRSLRIMAPI